MLEHGVKRGIAIKNSDWLVIPLCPDHHNGDHGIHGGVKTWEAEYGTQAMHLDYVSQETGIDVWETYRESLRD
jgi:hypothetical protein